MTQILILNNIVKFKKELDTLPVLDICYVESGELHMREFEWFPLDKFEEELDKLRSAISKNKNTLNLKVITRRDDEKFMLYTVKNKKIDVSECNVNIMPKFAKSDKKKTLKFDEQLGLFKEYFNINHKVPSPNEVYKSFKIGAFYAKMKTMEESVKLINKIVNDE